VLSVRLPTSKVYRAFPELDRFSDEQCRAFVRRASQDSALGSCGLTVLGLGLGVLTAVAWVVLLVLYARLTATPSGAIRLGAVWLVLLVVGVLVLSPLAGFFFRDVWLRAAIRASLARTNCRECRYSLLGLHATEGVVTCPECGKRIALADYNLTPEHLMGTVSDTPSAGAGTANTVGSAPGSASVVSKNE
jgi:hypothetical protein